MYICSWMFSTAYGGITRELQRNWGHEYLAGFWRASPVQHLGWMGGVAADEKFGGSRWTKRLEGPSWSWLSHPSSVRIDPVAFHDVKVLCFTVELAIPDQPFGTVKSGMLVLEACTLPFPALQTKVHRNSGPWKKATAILPLSRECSAPGFPDQGTVVVVPLS